MHFYITIVNILDKLKIGSLIEKKIDDNLKKIKKKSSKLT
jgi:hypothetical protein